MSSEVYSGPVVLYQDHQRGQTLVCGRKSAALRAGCRSASRSYRERCSGILDRCKAESSADSWAAYDREQNTRNIYLRDHSSGLSIPGVRKLEAARNQAIADYDSAQHRAFARDASDVWRIHPWGPLRRGPCTPRYQIALTATLKQW